MKSILIVEDDKISREAMIDILRTSGFAITAANDGEEASELLQKNSYDLVITDMNMPRKNGMELLAEVRRDYPTLNVIMVTAYGSIDKAVEAMKNGATDFLSKPVSIEELEAKVTNILNSLSDTPEEVRSESLDLNESSFKGMISGNSQMKSIFVTIEKVAGSLAHILIQGDSGTGKELVAHAIHDLSDRNNQPFVSVNCAALSEGILESELFGHEKGAFTGALQKRLGRFEEAQGGTIFLDEIGDLSQSVQVKLLRVIQEKEIERVGSNDKIKIDVRIITATNKNLKKMVLNGQYREDLYYRLNVVPIVLPTLRERKNDIPNLVEHFIQKYSKQMNRPSITINQEALNKLIAHNWPGNIRELENCIERVIVMCGEDEIQSDDIPDLSNEDMEVDPSLSLDDQKLKMEKVKIMQALEQGKGKQVKAAEILGIDRTTLRYRMKKHDLL